LPVFLLVYFAEDIASVLCVKKSIVKPLSFTNYGRDKPFMPQHVTYKNAVLAVFSVVFYAWGEPVWVILLITAAIVGYAAGRLIERFRDTAAAAAAAGIAIVFCLCVLGVFKYSGFIVENINGLLHTAIPVPKIRLPIGISFYTFQIISYILDCLWGNVNVQKSFLKFFTYVSMFPQLVAGPIVRYGNIEKALDSRRVTAAGVSEGITRFAVGLGKKVIIANNLSVVVDDLFKNSDLASLSVSGTWFAVAAYTLQMYFDFSGYSDMAIGLGKIIGFDLNENFNYPFVSKNITEFWQRWHISLGSFFRDYLLYVPIFGKRRQYASLFLVWFCTGLWHGASWNFIIWGLYFGVFIFIERMLGNKRMKKIPPPLAHLCTVLIFTVGFGIFYFTDFHKLGIFFGNLVGANGNALTDELSGGKFINNIFLFTAATALSLPVVPAIKKIAARAALNETLCGAFETASNTVLLCVSSILLVNATNNPFLYFNF